MAKRTGGGGGGGGGGEVGDSKQRPSKVTAFAPCARCGAAWYCSDACAAEDWKTHKRECKGTVVGFGCAFEGFGEGRVRGERPGTAASAAFLTTALHHPERV
jgi:hypothetical protein